MKVLGMKMRFGALTRAALSAGIVAASTVAVQAQSLYGCNDLAGYERLPSIEGKSGVFFRINPDLYNFHAMSEETVDQVAELARALESVGTKLIYVPMPTKSMVMPSFLTSESEDFGFDATLASTVYGEAVRRLRDHGVMTVDARRALVLAEQGDYPYFRADYRMTSTGSALLAAAIGGAIKEDEAYAELPRSEFNTTQTGQVALPSPMRHQLQQHCLNALPEAITETYETKLSRSTVLSSNNANFSNTTQSALVAVVGTEFTGEPAINFPGFLAQETGLDIRQYSVTGGGAFAAISTYLTSQEFQDIRPAYLVWENPIWNNLAKFGNQPMRELIVASSSACRTALPILQTEDATRVRADISNVDASLNYTLFIDTDGSQANVARFKFRAANGLERIKTIYRHPDQAKTGRFYMPADGIGEDDAVTVEIELDQPFGSLPRLTACYN